MNIIEALSLRKSTVLFLISRSARIKSSTFCRLHVMLHREPMPNHGRLQLSPAKKRTN
jgi:hypothetical protein